MKIKLEMEVDCSGTDESYWTDYWSGELDEFLEGNSFEQNEVVQMTECLMNGVPWYYGGGAGPLWSVRRVDD